MSKVFKVSFPTDNESSRETPIISATMSLEDDLVKCDELVHLVENKLDPVLAELLPEKALSETKNETGGSSTLLLNIYSCRERVNTVSTIMQSILQRLQI